MLIIHNFHQWFCSMLFRGIPIHKTTHVFILKTMVVSNTNTNVFLRKKHGVFQLLAIHGFYLQTIHVKSSAFPTIDGFDSGILHTIDLSTNHSC